METLSNKDILLFPNLYKSGQSSWAIAKRFGIDHKTVLSHLKKLGIEINYIFL